MQKRVIEYADKEFIFEFDSTDATGNGSIEEIIVRDDYRLSRFIGHKNKVFLDVGSAIGVAAVVMAKLNPESTVLAFEPYPKSYETIMRNAEINRVSNLQVFNYAVSNDKNQKLTLNICSHMSGANSTYADNGKFSKKYKCNKKIDIECISIDTIFERFNVHSVELLKIDCEGAEFDIIYGSKKFTEGIIKNLTGEFHDLSYNNTVNKSDELIAYCNCYVNEDVSVSVLRR